MSKKYLTDGKDLSGMLEVHHEDIPMETIIELRLKGLSHGKIAAALGCSRSNIQARLKRVQHELDILPDFKKHRADVYAIYGRRFLGAITPEKLKKASAKDLAVGNAVLYDKERLERGQSTSNVLYVDLVKARKEKEKELERVEAKMKSMKSAGGPN